MRLTSRKKVPYLLEREFRLRQIRFGAQTLRNACPTAAVVNVQLRFLPDAAFAHAEQSFVLYPGARAVFSYPCPYGDCDGIYDLSAAADQALNRQEPRITGLFTCSGKRARDGRSGQACGLTVRYTIRAQHEPTEVA